MAVSKPSGVPSKTPVKTAKPAGKSPTIQARSATRVRELVPEKPEVTVRFSKKMSDGMTLKDGETVAVVSVGDHPRDFNFNVTRTGMNVCAAYVGAASPQDEEELTAEKVEKYYRYIESEIRYARALLGSGLRMRFLNEEPGDEIEFSIPLGDNDYGFENGAYIIHDAKRWESLIREAFGKIGAKFEN